MHPFILQWLWSRSTLIWIRRESNSLLRWLPAHPGSFSQMHREVGARCVYIFLHSCLGVEASSFVFHTLFALLITPPSHNEIYSRNWYAFSMLILTKFPPPYGGGFHVFLNKTVLEQVHSARSLCTADARPLNGSENGPNLAKNRIEYVLLTTWDGNSIFVSSNQARPSSQKLPLNGFTEWNFLKNKGKISESGKKLIVWRGSPRIKHWV